MSWDIEPSIVLGSVGAMFTALSSVVGAGFYYIIGRLNSCEDSHKKNQEERLTMTRDMGNLEGQVKAVQSVLSVEFASVLSDKIVTKLNHGGVNRENS